MDIAIDLGTTNIEAAAKTKDGNVVFASAKNPQTDYGADVLTRITFAKKSGGLELLRHAAAAGINTLIEKLTGGGTAETTVISANTVMLHLVAGISPENMGVSPFNPQFTEAVVFSRGVHTGRFDALKNINSQNIILLPSVNAFLGADIVSGVVFAQKTHGCTDSVLLDFGTNGEIAVMIDGKIFGGSAAAGPAFEGAGIECGSAAATGAIYKACVSGDAVTYSVLGGGAATSLCASGLLDIIAGMLDCRLIDCSGALIDKHPSPRLDSRLSGGRFYITDNIYISQQDIRAFQLAKSAMRSCLETVLRAKKADFSIIQKAYVSGGFGNCLNMESAVKTGLLPESFFGKIEFLGNSSLSGALLALSETNTFEGIQTALNRFSDTVRQIKHVPMSGNKYFENLFIKNLNFC